MILSGLYTEERRTIKNRGQKTTAMGHGGENVPGKRSKSKRVKE
jgi:hypothetical protein